MKIPVTGNSVPSEPTAFQVNFSDGLGTVFSLSDGYTYTQDDSGLHIFREGNEVLTFPPDRIKEVVDQ